MGLVFHANNVTSQCPLTAYRKSKDGGVSFLACQQWYPQYSLTLYRKFNAVESTFWDTNGDAYQCPLALYRNSNGVELFLRALSHAKHGRSRVHLLSTGSPRSVELTFRHSNSGVYQCTLTACRKSNDGGVSLPAYQQRCVLVSTYLLQEAQG